MRKRGLSCIDRKLIRVKYVQSNCQHFPFLLSSLKLLLPSNYCTHVGLLYYDITIFSEPCPQRMTILGNSGLSYKK